MRPLGGIAVSGRGHSFLGTRSSMTSSHGGWLLALTEPSGVPHYTTWQSVRIPLVIRLVSSISRSAKLDGN